MAPIKKKKNSKLNSKFDEFDRLKKEILSLIKKINRLKKEILIKKIKRKLPKPKK